LLTPQSTSSSSCLRGQGVQADSAGWVAMHMPLSRQRMNQSGQGTGLEDWVRVAARQPQPPCLCQSHRYSRPTRRSAATHPATTPPLLHRLHSAEDGVHRGLPSGQFKLLGAPQRVHEAGRGRHLAHNRRGGCLLQGAGGQHAVAVQAAGERA
jgi:hypothetical protein